MSDQRESGQQGSDQESDAAPRPVALVIVLVGLAVALVVGVIIVVLQTTDDASAPEAGGAASSSRRASSPTASAETGRPRPSANPATRTAPAPTDPTGSTDPTDSTDPTGSSTTRPAEVPTSSPKPQPTRSPVPIKTPTEVKAGLTASITDVAAVQGQARGPGEVAGPAVRFTLLLRNDSTQEVPLSTTVVNLYYGKAKTPASELSEPGGTPLPATVAAGGEASGTYVFVVPRKSRDRVLITVDYSVDVSLVAFRGSVPR